ncbi:MraY family glycosyltransferase [Galbibacter pacificus]|uniref:MraY family glycosyltransferase n=1 Tax=Galbibacter pacificus TaxID=2996052 RepID=A0ABT6FNZ6_9FLAO|nr:MraY family glycosyltransferase [Galbibacter pacificus]MDG3581306.1 MraY family glycosyltransferase [Galbibacter pacificus]MDG3584784.1 MraY family glycosyltransferase [Galbibacter pacificus]
MYFLETAILLFIGGFLLTYFTIPKIIGVVEHKRLMDNPNSRSSHKKVTPTLGGVAFFYCLIFAIFFLKERDLHNEAIYLIPGLTILFIVGLKDDLVVLSPLTKLGAQILAVSFVLASDSFIITSLHGFLNINEIPYFLYLLIGGFFMITIINAYNLIDGIDGLAAMVGIVILILYTTIFYMSHEYFYALLCIALNACLIAFLGYNLSSTRKIFMGDTGSLIVGFMLAMFTLKFLALKPTSYKDLPFLLENAPLVAIGILIVPLFDTARVFTLRIVSKKGPFSPDRNHTHHILVDYLNLSHQQASFIIASFNFIFVVLLIVLGSTSNNLWMILALVTTVVFLAYLFYRLDYSFANLKRKIFFKRKVESFRERLKKRNKNK